ncbi:MAG: hypothetical protein JW864_05205, partial [Spirochaetes bacterium]|nr:hypothetical protein [Spirochaetota bacterium]
MNNKIVYLVLIPLSLAVLIGPSCEKKNKAGSSDTQIKESTDITAKTKSGNRDTGCIDGDCKDGYGTFIYDDGSAYTGEFKNGKRHGKGKMTWASGSMKGETYEGEWSDNEINGTGTYTYSDGSKYT